MKTGKILSLSMVSALLMTACFSQPAGGPDKSPEEVVQEATQNMQDVKSAEFVVNIDGEVEASDSEKGAQLGLEEELDFNLALRGAYDVRTQENIRFSFDIDASGALEEGNDEEFAGEMRMVNNSLYFVLKGLSDFDGEVPTMLVEPYLNQWWSMPLPADFAATLEPYAGDESEMSPEAKELRELVRNTQFFKNLKYTGEDDLNGVAVWKYSGEVDQEALIEYMEKSMEIYGSQYEQLSEEEMQELKEVYRKMMFEGEIWIAQEDMTARKFDGRLEMEVVEGLNLEFDIDYEISNLDGDIAIDEPADAKVFDLFSLMMGGAMVDPAATVELDATGIPSDIPAVPEGFEMSY